MAGNSSVLFVLGTLAVGGSETKIVKVVNALKREGYPAGIAYLNPPETLLERIEPGVPVFNLGRRGKYSLQSLRQLRRVVGSGYDTLVSINFYPLLYVLPAARRRPDHRCRTIAFVNTTEFVDGQWIWGHFYAPFLRRCDRIVFGCDAQLRIWTRKYRLPEDRSSFIHNGVDLERFSPGAAGMDPSELRARLSIPTDAVVIGSVGRLAPEKNFALLVRAVAALNEAGKEAYLLLVGEGAEKPALTAAAAQSGIPDKVILAGVLADVRAALSAMDVFVLPSRAVETFSNAALEAMALERPVVLSNIGGAGEMLVHGDSGFLFESEDADALGVILNELYDSAALRQRVGRSARARAIEHFGFERMLESYKLLFYR
jgi:glycosyltransferase involved in cell wall biosynthesis